MTNKERRLFEVARAVSKTSSFERIKIGAVLVSGNRIISVGTNSEKSHPRQKALNKFRKTGTTSHDDWKTCKDRIHAELEAILHAPYDIMNNSSSLSLFVFREGCAGELRNCRPCPACMAAIKARGIRTIYYTTEEGYVREDLTA